MRIEKKADSGRSGLKTRRGLGKELLCSIGWAVMVIANSAAQQVANEPAAAAKSLSPWAPQIHLYAPPNWINDPNGPILLNGQYNLFYQYNPFGDQWGHMSWGHAVTTDLIHWKQLPVAISEADGVMIFSGSTVEDKNNTSGLCGDAGKKTPGCVIAIYTGASETKQTQNLAYSRDGGVTFAKYSGNPIIDLGLKDFRDPKVFWYPPSSGWIMVAALPDQHKVRFYRSKNLRQWEQAGEFGPAGGVSGVWECPDLFELPVRETPGKLTSTSWASLTARTSQRIIPAQGRTGAIGAKIFTLPHRFQTRRPIKTVSGLAG
jgi:sucrose-6-phosphate hydrolase SacC (GH32 family)